MSSNEDRSEQRLQVAVEAAQNSLDAKVFSHTAGSWLPATVTSIAENTRDPSSSQVAVEYSTEDQNFRKTLTLHSQDLRLTSSRQALESINPCTEIGSDYGSDSDHFSCGEFPGSEADEEEHDPEGLCSGEGLERSWSPPEEHDPEGFCTSWESIERSWSPPDVLLGEKDIYYLAKKKNSRGKRRAAMLGKGNLGIAYHYTSKASGSSVCVKFPKWGKKHNEQDAFDISQMVNPRKSYSKHVSPALELLEHVEDAPDGVATVWGWGGQKTFYAFMEKLPMENEKCSNMIHMEKLTCLKHILLGIQNLHLNNYIHGDLHAKNVMICYLMRNCGDRPRQVSKSLVQTWHKKKKPGLWNDIVDLCNQGKRKQRRGLWLNLIDLGDCRRCGEKWAMHIPFPADGVLFNQWPPELSVDNIVVGKRLQNFEDMKVHPSHDIWSVGMLYYKLCAARGAELPDPRQFYRKIVDSIEDNNGRTEKAKLEVGRSISSVVSDLSHFDAQVLTMMLQPSPDKRPTARALLKFVESELLRIQKICVLE